MYMLGIATFIDKGSKAVSLLRLAVDTDPDTTQIKTIATSFDDSPTAASTERDVSGEFVPYSGDTNEDTIAEYLQENMRKYAKERNLWTLTATVCGAVAKKNKTGTGTQVCSVLTDSFVDGRIIDGRGGDVEKLMKKHTEEFADKVLDAKCEDMDSDTRAKLREKIVETLQSALNESDGGSLSERAEKMRDKIEALIESAKNGDDEEEEEKKKTVPPPAPRIKKDERTHDEHAAAIVRLADQIRDARNKFGDEAAKKLARSIYQRTHDDAVLTAEAIAFGKKRRATTKK